MSDNKITFQILFTSDLHGAFRDYNYSADKGTDTGLSRIATLMKQDRDSFNGRTFICDCGDSIQGNGTKELVTGDDKNNVYKPYPIFAAFDAIGYDFVVLGNHEFNFGLEKLYSSFEGYNGKKLCGNVFKNEDGDYLDGFSPYVICEVPGGPRVAFIGMVSPNIDIWDKAYIKDAKIHSTDAAEETKRVIEKLTEKNLADIFIAVEHMDEISELDRKGSGAEEVTIENPEIAVFLGAHYHTIKGSKDNQHVLSGGVKFAENLNSGMSYGKVLITASFKDGKWTIENKAGECKDCESGVKTDIIQPPPETPNDPDVMRVTEEAHKYIKDYMSGNVVGQLKCNSLIDAPVIKGTHEGILSNNALITLVTNIMLEYSEGKIKSPKADIAAAALNSFDANCPKGEITEGKISQIYVYDNNTMYKLKMSGRQILKWMEWSYAYFGVDLEKGKPAVNLDTDLTIPYGTRKVYLHDKFAGINYTVDLTKPVGNRINVLGLKDGRKFDINEYYYVVTTNYRAETNLLFRSKGGIFEPGDEVAELIDDGIISPDGKRNMLEWISEYIQSKKDSTIYPEVENNCEFINLNWDTELRKQAIELINNGTISDYSYRKPVTKSQIEKIILQSNY